MDTLITKEMITQGYKYGIIRLTTDTEFYENAESNTDEEIGVVCAIGDNWFYFGGEEADCSTIVEYKKNFTEDTIIQQIYDTIQTFSEDWELNGDEYMYYYYFLCEKLNITVNTKKTIYEELSRVLTDYECNGNSICKGDVKMLYEMLVKIQNSWEEITAKED